jgi:hypothetical protein
MSSAPAMIEILYFDGCPNHHGLEEHIRALCAGLGTDMPVVSRRVETDDHATAEQFLGSPTVRVNGVDVDPTAAGRRAYGLTCRVYSIDGRMQGTPPDAWIVAAIAAVS